MRFRVGEEEVEELRWDRILENQKLKDALPIGKGLNKRGPKPDIH